MKIDSGYLEVPSMQDDPEQDFVRQHYTGLPASYDLGESNKLADNPMYIYAGRWTMRAYTEDNKGVTLTMDKRAAAVVRILASAREADELVDNVDIAVALSMAQGNRHAIAARVSHSMRPIYRFESALGRPIIDRERFRNSGMGYMLAKSVHVVNDLRQKNEDYGLTTPHWREMTMKMIHLRSASFRNVAIDTSANRRDEWWVRAGCRDEELELFFPQRQGGLATLQAAEAKSVCGGCPVRSECLDWALESNQKNGVWGGMSEDERRILHNRRNVGTI